jgi:hypothetical protein
MPRTHAQSRSSRRILASRSNWLLLWSLAAIIWQLCKRVSAGFHWRLRAGILLRGRRIADILEEWFVEQAADGFNILPPYFPGAFGDFVDLVVPELQRRGLFRRDYEGKCCATISAWRRSPTAPRSPHTRETDGCSGSV